MIKSIPQHIAFQLLLKTEGRRLHYTTSFDYLLSEGLQHITGYCELIQESRRYRLSLASVSTRLQKNIQTIRKLGNSFMIRY